LFVTDSAKDQTDYSPDGRAFEGGWFRPQCDPGAIRRLQEARRCRGVCLGNHLFSDPAWDILLELYARQLERRASSVLELARAARLPDATLIRWVTWLCDDDLVRRTPHPLDNRKIQITLTEAGFSRIRSCLEQAADLLRSP
jgi:DNA-binding MarR family transcriptional regulator